MGPEKPADAALDDVRTLTLEEVAGALRVSYDTVRDWACMGRLPGAVKVGRWWRIRYWEFKRWLDLGCPGIGRW